MAIQLGSARDAKREWCACEACGNSDGTTGGVVACRSRSDVAPGCPALRPLLGTPCATEGLSCAYDNCCGLSLGPSMQCADGYWRVLDNCKGVACGGIPSCPSS